MALIIRISSAQPDHYVWIDDGNADAGATTGSAEQLRAAASGQRAVLLLDSTAVLNTEVTVPARNRALLEKALPYAVEDLIAQDPDTVTIVAGPRQEDDRYPVAIIDRARLDALVGELNQCDVALAAVVPDIYGVPFEPECLSIVIDRDYALIRYAQFGGCKTHISELAVTAELLARASRGEDWRSIPITIYGSAGETVLPDAFTQVQTLALPADGEAFTLLAGALNDEAWINLLGTDDAKRTGPWQPWIVLRAAAALLLVAVLTHFGMQYWRTARIEQAAAELMSGAESEYRRLFPDAGRLVDLRAQAQQRVNALEARHGDELDLLSTLHRLGAAFIAAPAGSLRFTSLTYGAEQLVVTLAAADIEAVESYQRRLSDADLDVNLLSAETGSDEVSARLRISRPRG